MKKYREKKYEQALALIKNQNDIYSIFLRSQIYLAKSNFSFFDIFLEEPKTAFELLATSLTDALVQNDEFLIFLLRQLVNYKLDKTLSTLI